MDDEKKKDTTELFVHLDQKLDKIHDRMGEFTVILTKHDMNLGEHMRRSDNLEKQNTLIRAELEPVKKHVGHVEGAIKLIGFLSLLGGLLKLFGII